MVRQAVANRRGITLSEIVVSTLLVGAVVVGALSTLGASVRTQKFAREVLTGPLLADALLAEILAKAYDDPEDGGATLGIDNGEDVGDRDDFDDVDDYDGWASSPIRSRGGNDLTRYVNWTWTARVKWADRLSGNEWLLYNTGLKRILVEVTAPDGTITRRHGFRSAKGSLEQPDIIDKTVVTQIETTLTVSATTDAAYGVTNLTNHVENPN